MPAFRHAGFLILILGVVFLPAVVFSGFPKNLKLEKAFLVDQRVELIELRTRDRSIVVNGQILPIDLAVIVTSSNRGTIIDSGTTLAYLEAEANDPLENAVNSP